MARLHTLLTRALCATVLVPLLVGVAQAQQQPSLGSLVPAWSAQGFWTGVVGDDDAGRIYAVGPRAVGVEFDAAGRKQREIPLPENAGSIVRLATLDADGSKALLTFGTWSHQLQAYRVDGKPLWNYPHDSGIDDVWAGDLDGDKVDEVVIGYNGDGGLHVLNGRSRVLWKTTDIANVWSVATGRVLEGGETQVLSTSANGNVHIFGDHAKILRDFDLPIYASLVRVGRVAENDATARIFAAGSLLAAAAGQGETLVALATDGTKQWSLPLSASAESGLAAPDRPWLALGLSSGVVNVVDLEHGRILATIEGQGMNPEVAWLKRPGPDGPLLLIATGEKLNAFNVRPK